MSRGLAIVGYGKMGRLIEQLAPEYGFDVRAKFNSCNNPHGVGLTRDALRGVEVALEFSGPDAALENILWLAAAGVNAVVGSTGWFDCLPSVRDPVEQGGTGLVWSPNFSVGVNLFVQVVAHAASLLAKQPGYEAWGWEIHHSAKKDAPSGTLKKLAEEIRASGYDRTLTLTANRAGSHPGTHEIGLIAPPTPSRCGTPRAAVKVLPAARCRPRGGSWASAEYLNFARSSVNWTDGTF